ncbi:helix-turn-helix domain-containing protein [Streptomyces sp. BI20]|uniref:helix-turn-helix domain-containing protein n=1 Tax=Streptomyces sp. BI20 TaxID=3403460 RepID=UPI003C72EC56
MRVRTRRHVRTRCRAEPWRRRTAGSGSARRNRRGSWRGLLRTASGRDEPPGNDNAEGPPTTRPAPADGHHEARPLPSVSNRLRCATRLEYGRCTDQLTCSGLRVEWCGVNRKKLDPAAGAREALGVRLRSLRDQRGWSCETMSTHLGYAASHIAGVETGRRTFTLDMARAVDLALGLVDHRDSFVAEVERLRGGTLMEGYPEYLVHEARAAELRAYEVGVVAGLLQTKAYARELAAYDARRGIISADQADERVRVTMARQEALTRTPPMLLHFILDESCIRRPVGSPEVWSEQLAALERFAEGGNTILQVAPFDMGTERPLRLPVYILTMPSGSFMSWAESAQRGHLERDARAVRATLRAYYQLQAGALSQPATLALLRDLRKGKP